MWSGVLGQVTSCLTFTVCKEEKMIFTQPLEVWDDVKKDACKAGVSNFFTGHGQEQPEGLPSHPWQGQAAGRYTPAAIASSIPLLPSCSADVASSHWGAVPGPSIFKLYPCCPSLPSPILPSCDMGTAGSYLVPAQLLTFNLAECYYSFSTHTGAKIPCCSWEVGSWGSGHGTGAAPNFLAPVWVQAKYPTSYALPKPPGLCWTATGRTGRGGSHAGIAKSCPSLAHSSLPALVQVWA